ncbi:hypothetical protein UVI_02010910 [Ustilaginoidea virens]|uniref:Uncharacterized protein n=1 Tax=Ustilaginoidea virens TaxID=1159556 RepID=A0A1B5KZF2_USTVR|nr:hypothetical protein UVI_02010910 [Ustilaginoidea virens]
MLSALTVSSTEYRETICSFLSTDEKLQRLDIFSLPASTRQKIYREAGLPYNDHVLLPSSKYQSPLSSEARATISGLLVANKAVSSEASKILYSANAFTIWLTCLEDLRPILAFSARTISMLTNLIIQCDDPSRDCQTLLCSSFGLPDACPCCRHPKLASEANRPSTFWEFRDVLRHVVSHATPFGLHLGISINVGDAETARCLLEPLRSTSTLADCAIRLSKRPDMELQSIARQFALQAMGKVAQEPAFRFMDLPREIRLQVLEETDLQIPDGEVEWSPLQGYHAAAASTFCGQEYVCFSGYLDDPFLKQGFFCAQRHSSFSQHCHCWCPPTALLLCSRRLREEALGVFFRSNRFTVVPKNGCTLPVRKVQDEPDDRLEASIFLRNVVPFQALSYLRFLEIVFPPFDYEFLPPNHTAYRDWIELLDFLSGVLSPSQLVLRVHFADYDSTGYKRTYFRVNMTPAGSEAIARAYERTLMPLEKLRRSLKCLFIHLANPWSWASASIQDIDVVRREARVHMQATEQRLEKLIMADDGYDGVARGKNSEKKSRWLLSAEYKSEFSMPVYGFDPRLNAWV